MTQPPQYPGSPDPDPSEQPGGQTPPPFPQQPAPPSYGAPEQQSPYGAPQYGAPQYGAPQYGGPQQQPYGAPTPYGQAHPGGPGHDQPSKAMAITALVLSFIGCTLIAGLVSIVLAIIVLVRGKDGRNHGKGLAIGAICVSVVTILIGVLGIVGIVALAESQDIDNLKVGQCFDADDLADPDSDTVGFIDKTSCDGEHDGQVVGTGTVSAEQAASSSTGIDCRADVDPRYSAVLSDPENLIIGLTPDTSPETGDTLVCIVTRVDGEPLTGDLG